MLIDYVGQWRLSLADQHWHESVEVSNVSINSEKDYRYHRKWAFFLRRLDQNGLP